MNIYDELTKNVLDPDVVEANIKAGKGYAYPGQYQVGEIPEHWEILDGTDGLRKRVPAQPIYEDCLWYHTYTPEELKPTWQDRMESQLTYTAMMTDTLIEEG